MGYPSRSAVILAVGVVMFAVVPHSSAKEPASREEIRDAIARWWDSTDSIDATFELTRSDDGPERVYQEDRVAIASGGKYFVRSFFIGRDGQRVQATNQGADGDKAFRITPLPGKPDIADTVTVLNSPCTNDTYVGGMDELLWLLMPGGKRLNRSLDDGAELTVDRNDDGSDRYVVEFTFRFKSNPVRCELDPAHDWLPRVVEVGKPRKALQIHVTRYKLVEGRFIPSEADVFNKSPSGKESSSRFLLRSVSVNGDLDPGIFKPKGLVAGTQIDDEDTGKSRIHEGNARTRLAFLERYYPKPKTGAMKDDVKSLEPLRAERTPSEWPVVPILGVSGLLLLASIFVHRRRA
ncbi:LolA family protein [Paludisphaera rhizosphaerae]|uniref:LolA family protein n=1 Tax=Paludisphaera rhizosphaerae TaxID=2711216 RepID=UPI0013EA6947|nr:hypothetical protein [Paludisphaera rhizosphaerae]